jgi:hypothetical protein
MTKNEGRETPGGRTKPTRPLASDSPFAPWAKAMAKKLRTCPRCEEERADVVAVYHACAPYTRLCGDCITEVANESIDDEGI